MTEIKKWFEESDTVYKRRGYEFVLVKGFKITHYLKEGEYTIVDTRFNSFSKSVSEDNMEIFRENGFLKGASIIMHSRNIKRVDYYLGRIQKLLIKKAKYKEILRTQSYEKGKAASFYQKGIKNINVNTHELNDLMHFYKSKVDQFNNNKEN